MQARSNGTKSLRICCIWNRDEERAALQASFLAAGFSEEVCRYTLFDNSERNAHDPFRTIDRLWSDSPEPYAILCHQDVRIPPESRFETLMTALDDLNRRDPNWALAGWAGVTPDFRVVLYGDPEAQARFHTENLPQRVQTLDECFLIFNVKFRLSCSPELSGFHLYATDACLHAQQRGHRCYAIPFRVEHRSEGTIDEGFAASLDALQRRWNPQFAFRYVSSPVAWVFLSRVALLRRIFGHPFVMRLARQWAALRHRLRRKPYFVTVVHDFRAIGGASPSKEPK